MYPLKEIIFGFPGYDVSESLHIGFYIGLLASLNPKINIGLVEIKILLIFLHRFRLENKIAYIFFLYHFFFSSIPYKPQKNQSLFFLLGVCAGAGFFFHKYPSHFINSTSIFHLI